MRIPNPGFHAGTRAFTLMELLVVITIAGVLASLVLAGLRNTRASASTAVCVNNMKRITEAVLAYANDNGGEIIQSRTGPSGGTYWTWRLQPYLQDYVRPEGQFLAKNAVLCPLMKEKGFRSEQRAGGSGYYVSYGLNSAVSTDGSKGVAAVRLARVAQPSKVPLVTDLTAFVFAYFSYTRTDADYFTYLHGNAQNFGFLDGHVEALTRKQIPTDQTNVFWTGGLNP
ncbi:MAG: prepilin-type N-terminal cleavage/methylation domain-containing protein [Verrucomicrobia bacterium]|nr:prepilin-type N-terminal cleavage/methylation domain-containing protein [Verrucomicrobiota bacterium]